MNRSAGSRSRSTLPCASPIPRKVWRAVARSSAARSVGLLGEVGTQPPARGAVPDAADDPLGALLQLLLGARIGVRGVVVDDGDRILDREEAGLERVLRRGPAAGQRLPVERTEM